jgi:predicted HicB family RNase H-like nuclease
MAIAKKPISNQNAETEKQALAFIAKAGKEEQETGRDPNRKPTMIRIPPALLERIDFGAKRLGISRSAFIVQSAAEKLERMEG